MSSPLHFDKMHGLGNDFVVLDGLAHPEVSGLNLAELASRLCHRRLSVGADGLIAVLPADGFDCRMRIFNTDGSEAQMCGNGIRCVARLLWDRRHISRPQARIITLAGERTVDITLKDNAFESATVDMGIPRLHQPLTAEVKVNGTDYEVTPPSLGNPHGVVFVDDVNNFEVGTVGPALENCALFPEGANIEFATPVPALHAIIVRTWERGVGETLACGTGACAAAAAALASGRMELPVTIMQPGGSLKIALGEASHLMMSGPAVFAYSGTVNI